MSNNRHHSPPSNRSKSFFVKQPDGSLRCPTCAKERVDCLRWNKTDGVYEYRLRTPSYGEQVVTTTHPEIGPVRILAKWATHHGSRYAVIAQRIVCAGGLMTILDWTSSSIRAYGSVIPGRLKSGRRSRSAKNGRNAPIPLKFLTERVYDWVFRFLVPVPKDPEEFLRLMAICSRMVDEGNGREQLVEYADDLCRFFNWEPPADDH
jgi:hypothetical protein